MSTFRDFIFTIFNILWTPDDLDKTNIAEINWQLEETKDGRAHYQVHVKTINPCRVTQMVKWSGGPHHCEGARRAFATKNYCMKEESRVAGPWQWKNEDNTKKNVEWKCAWCGAPDKDENGVCKFFTEHFFENMTEAEEEWMNYVYDRLEFGDNFATAQKRWRKEQMKKEFVSNDSLENSSDYSEVDEASLIELGEFRNTKGNSHVQNGKEEAED